MNTNNHLCLAAFLILVACTPKAPETKAPESKQDSLPENICIEQPLDTIVADTVVVPPPPPMRNRTFIPPVIVDCEDIDTEVMCSLPEYIEPERRTAEENTPFIHVEEMPTFPGGDSAMLKFIAENLKYTDTVPCIEGWVILRFVVDKEGNIKDVVVLRSLDSLLDKEAIRVVKSMPKWSVGKQNGFPVDVYFTLPISFRVSK